MLKKVFPVCFQNVKALYIQCCMYDIKNAFITFSVYEKLQEVNEYYAA